MAETKNYLEEVGSLIKALNRLDFKPILVGGMALVTLGSRRVTRDFDFVISKPKETLEDLVDTFYRRGLELAAKLDENGNVIATIDNPKVATARLKLDEPPSAYFLNHKTGLRVDLLFDFPLAAAELAKKAKKIKISSQLFHIACEEDLIRMKKIAKAGRSNSADDHDLEFLRKRLGD